MFAGDSAILLLQVKALSGPGISDPVLPYPAAGLDPQKQFFPLRHAFQGQFTWGTNDKRYGKYSEPFAFIGALLYKVAGYPGLQALPLLFGVGALVVAAVLAAAIGIRRTWAVPLVLGLGTPLLYYSLNFSTHTAAVFFACLSLWLCVLYSRNARRLMLVLAGASLGLAAAFRPEILVLCVAIPLAQAFTSLGLRAWLRTLSVFAAGCVLTLAPLALLHYHRSANIVGAHIVADSRGLADLGQHHIRTLAQVFVPAGHRKWAAVLCLALLVAVLAWYYRGGFSAKHKDRCVYLSALVILLGYSVITTLHVLTGYVPHISFTDTFPASALVLLGFALYRRTAVVKKRAIAFLALSGAAFVLLVTLAFPSWGGRGWGPRYVLLGYPVAAVLAWWVAERIGTLELPSRLRAALLASAGCLILLSGAIQGLGVIREQRDRREFAAIESATRSLRPSIVLTDLGILPQLVAPVWEDVQMLGVCSREELGAAIALLRSKDVDYFWWASTDYPPWRLWVATQESEHTPAYYEDRTIEAVRIYQPVKTLRYTLYRIRLAFPL